MLCLVAGTGCGLLEMLILRLGLAWAVESMDWKVLGRAGRYRVPTERTCVGDNVKDACILVRRSWRL